MIFQLQKQRLIIFFEVFKILNEITPGISPKKIRETKKIVKKIVDESASSPEAKSIIVGIDDLDQLDLSNKPLAVAIGYKESVLSSVGYGMLSDNQILKIFFMTTKILILLKCVCQDSNQFQPPDFYLYINIF